MAPESQIIRPGVGNVGRPIPVTVNAYKVKVPDLIIHHYDIRITAPGDKDPEKNPPPALCRSVFRLLKDNDAFGKVIAIYDGQRALYTPKRLDYPEDTASFDVDMPEDDDEEEAPMLVAAAPPLSPSAGGDRGRGGGGRGARGGDRGGRGRGRGGGAPSAPAPAITSPPAPPAAAPRARGAGGALDRRTRKFAIKIEKVGEANLLALTRFVKKQDTPPADGAVLLAINALNVLCNHDVMMNHVSKKGNKFFPQPRVVNEDMIQLSQGLDIWRGYFSSIRMAPGGLILNFDITSQVMIRPGNLVGRLMELLGKQSAQDLINLPPRDRTTAERALKTLTVTAKVAGGRTAMKKKVQELTSKGAKAITFTLDDGKTTNVADYFLSTHNYRLQHPELPCVRLTKKAYYPLEVCSVSSGQKYNRKLDADQLASAIRWLTVKPPDRMRMLEQGLRANFQPDPAKPSAMVSWGFSLEKPQAMQVRARLLEAPKVVLKERRGSNVVESAMPVKDGSWDMRSKSVCTPAPPITAWIVVVFARPGGRFFSGEDLETSISGFMEGMKNTGLRINPPALKLWAGKQRSDINPPGDLGGYLRNCVRQKNLAKPQLVLCYFDDKHAWQYAEIKRFGDLTTGTATQGLAIQKVKRGNAQYYGNVALKVNVKLGGANQILAPADMGPAFQRPTMILGADVAHPGPGSTRPSVAAVVASMNKHGSGYVPEFRVQQARVEIIVQIAEMMKTLLLRFKDTNKVFPENIIFYRDGVSEGQFALVLEEEIPEIRKAFFQLDRTWQPRLTFIICGKRHHYRFGAVSAADQDRSGNVKPGLVVDTDIVHPYDFDWYCQSHSGLLGTSRSSHYTVLVDDSQFSADVLQKLTYHLCYLYSRATRSVSIVTPAYYAHHVCTRATLWLAEDEDDSSTILTGSSGEKDRQLTRALEAWTSRQDKWRKIMADNKRQFSGEFWM